MTTNPNMKTITSSLERSFQNCSLNRDGAAGSAVGGAGRSAISDEPQVELNSQVPLPYNWQQCLDLKTGEIYYRDWENGTKTKEDPRKTARAKADVLDLHSEEESSYSNGYDEYDSEGSSCTSSTPPSSRDDYRDEGDHVLVVAGCKRCFMYFMIPKHAQECPKCTGPILHLDQSVEKRLP